MTKSALGRGLGALLGGAGSPPSPPSTPAIKPVVSTPPAQITPPVVTPPPEVATGKVLHVPIGKVHASLLQPRKDFSAESLNDLADSIRVQGIIQPLIVRKSPNGYELIAGERRLRAAGLVGLQEVPIIVREADDRNVLELALIENLQRENLNPIEEALGYSQLIDSFNLTQDEAATKVGRSRVVVANALRLLKLAPQVQSYLRDGLVSVGHAKAILGLGRSEEQVMVAERVIRDGMTVRDAEQLVSGISGRAGKPAGSKGKSGEVNRAKDAMVEDIEAQLREKYGTKVHLKYKTGKGTVEIHFYNDDDLNRILKVSGIQLD